MCHRHQVLWPCLPDAPKTKAFYESASFKKYVAVNQRFADVIVSMYAEGDKIQAFKAFLDKYPEYQGKMTEENEIQGGVADVVSHLNSRFRLLHTNLCQYLVLLTVADAFVVTSLREAMALRPLPAHARQYPALRASRPDLATISPAISPAAAYVHLQEAAQS
ncbi:hypothetical protein A0H81_03841 [Grifola frondosa]|uniref:Uncharacterized protein n=1 Tax=Grifola frondosa TaxID=5627 RepID=A0A1C7MK04_GRIFR|nr:hypothetical protein A0H81_03841 [Grifola frondosa]